MEAAEPERFKYEPAPEGAEMTPAALKALNQQQEVAKRIKLTVERITPMIAAQWMEDNYGNRPISKIIVTKYKAKEKQGRWQLIPAMIAFDSTGRLIDGQHRLLMCIETGIPFYCIVARGFDPISQDATDRGHKRSLAGQLAKRHEENYSLVSGVLTKYWALIRHRLHWQGGGNSGGANGAESEIFDVDEGIALFETDPTGFREVVSIAGKAGRTLKITPSLAGCLYYAFGKVDAQDNEVFWEWLFSGSDMHERHPILVLRNKLVENMGKPTDHRINQTRMAAYIIKGWNHYYNGQEVSDIRWYPGGSRQEPFPIIAGFDGYLFERRPRGRTAKSEKKDD